MGNEFDNRYMIWDAENRLKEIIDNKEGLFHSCRYNHTGERILKRYGTAQNAFYNGKDMGNCLTLEQVIVPTHLLIL